MRTRIGWLGLLLTAGLTMASAARGQDASYAPPEHQWPLPLYSTHPDLGGLYTAGEFILFHQTNPLEHQLIAVRGFIDADGSITGNPGTLVGSGRSALYADDAGGPSTYQPGFIITVGWRFDTGSPIEAVELNWWHLQEAKYAATAGIEPFAFQGGQNLANTFLTSFVFNFPSEFAGPPRKVSGGNDGATFGIWNAASNMEIQFIQRFEQFDITSRIPLFETECNKTYATMGARLVWIWEKFSWRTVAEDFAGQAGPGDTATYTNITSNRLYGVHFGCGDDWFWGDTPIGAFACTLDGDAAPLVDIVKERAKYELGDHSMSAHRAKTDATISAELSAALRFYWYPTEGVQLRVGYQGMAFFNTRASPEPVSFNFGALDPPWVHEFRFFHGLEAGVGISF